MRIESIGVLLQSQGAKGMCCQKTQGTHAAVITHTRLIIIPPCMFSSQHVIFSLYLDASLLRVRTVVSVVHTTPPPFFLLLAFALCSASLG